MVTAGAVKIGHRQLMRTVSMLAALREVVRDVRIS